DRAHLGESALEEVAAGSRSSVDEELKTILQLVPSQHGPQAGGYRASIPASDVALEAEADADFPWQKGARLARRARERWGLGESPISNKMLADLLGAPVSLFTGGTVPTRMPVAFRVEDGSGGLDIYLNRPRS